MLRGASRPAGKAAIVIEKVCVVLMIVIGHVIKNGCRSGGAHMVRSGVTPCVSVALKVGRHAVTILALHNKNINQNISQISSNFIVRQI